MSRLGDWFADRIPDRPTPASRLAGALLVLGVLVLMMCAAAYLGGGSY